MSSVAHHLSDPYRGSCPFDRLLVAFATLCAVVTALGAVAAAVQELIR